jgi:hypothetical protein
MSNNEDLTPETTKDDILPGEFFDDRCPKRQEAARKSADTRAYDDVPTRRNMTFGQRLDLGFEMLADEANGTYDDDE